MSQPKNLENIPREREDWPRLHEPTSTKSYPVKEQEQVMRTNSPREHPLGQKGKLTLKIWDKRVAAIFAH